MPRPPRPDALILSPSAIEKLSGCEAKWMHRRNSEIAAAQESPGRPLVLGSAVGEGLEEYHNGGRRGVGLLYARLAVHDMAAREAGWSEKWNLPDPYPTALWMLDRYDQWYHRLGAERYQMRNTEVPFEHSIAPGVWIQGYLDGVAEYRGGLWVVEYKTSGKMDRFAGLEYELQPWVYIAGMRKIGVPIEGVLYEYGYTVEYKTDQPVEKTWHRKEVPFDAGLLAHYEEIARKAGERALALASGELEPARHVSAGCRWCPYLGPCLRPGDEQFVA